MLPSAEFELETLYRVIAPHYDLLFEDLYAGEDVTFYRQLTEGSPGPVLEMGCGTGRVLLPLARDGAAMYGMDCSLAMLEQLRARLCREDRAVRDRVTVVHGDIRRDDAGRRFPLIIAAGNVLHSFVDRQDQRSWLRNVRRHLTPDGVFCFDLFQFDYKRLTIPPDTWMLDIDRLDPQSGQRIRCYSRCEHEPEFQRFRVKFRWTVENGSAKTVAEKSASAMQRWFTRGELENLLELEGFQVTDYWGGFRREAFGRGSRQQVVRAVRGSEIESAQEAEKA
jgi:SAM-dependent methyltransferase